MVFWPKLPKFLAKLNFDFRCTTSVGMLFFEFLQIVCTKGSWRYGSDKKALQTNGRTDGRTHGHTRRKNNICLPQGETYNNKRVEVVVKLSKNLFLATRIKIYQETPLSTPKGQFYRIYRLQSGNAIYFN